MKKLFVMWLVVIVVVVGMVGVVGAAECGQFEKLKSNWDIGIICDKVVEGYNTSVAVINFVKWKNMNIGQKARIIKCVNNWCYKEENVYTEAVFIFIAGKPHTDENLLAVKHPNINNGNVVYYK